MIGLIIQVSQEATNHDSNDDEQTYQWVTWGTFMGSSDWIFYDLFIMMKTSLWLFHYEVRTGVVPLPQVLSAKFCRTLL